MPGLLPTLLLALLALTFPVACRRSSLRHHVHHSEDSFNEIADNEDEDRRLVLQHSRRVSEGTSCEVPKLQVVHVKDHYPGRYYQPHCTLLHRCGKHAGCCAVESLKCVAAEKERVVLYFHSVKLDGTDKKIEKLAFTNHTRCGCAFASEHPHRP